MTRTTAERVTLASVAEEAGVSLSTISKVLNGRPDVSAATRGRVEDMLAHHGYLRRKSAHAGTGLIELVFHELESAWSMEIIRGVEDVATENGMSVVLTESGSRHAPAPDWIEGVLRRRPIGVVLVFSDLPTEYRESLRSRAIPFVIIDPAGDPSPGCPVGRLGELVGRSDGDPSPHRARSHPDRRDHRPRGHDVLARAHRRLPLGDELGGPADRPRLDPLRRLPHRRAVSSTAANCWRGPTGRPRSSPGATSRRSACSRRSAASACGCPTISPSSATTTSRSRSGSARRLTTIRQPLKRMAEEASRLVIRMSKAPLENVPRMDLATSLVVRESTAAPAS